MASTLNETVREDGLRVITKKLQNTKKVILAVSALAGLSDDHEDKEGLMHFFEHMAFKGTTTKSMKDVKKLLGRFVYPNAYTDWLRTCYYAVAPHVRTHLLQDIIFDIYLHPVFPQDEIEKEKEVVLNETAKFENYDCSKADNELSKLLWKKNPVRRVSCGTPEGLSKITRETLFEAHRKWYVSSNTAIVAVGNVNHENLVKTAFAAFPLGSGKITRRVWDDEATENPAEKKTVVERRDRACGVVLFGCKVPRFSDKEKDVVTILNRMLGHSFDSLLFEEIREKRGYVYSTWSQFTDVTGLAGSLQFCAEMLPARLAEVADLVFDVVCNYKLEEAHFLRTKEAVFDALLIDLEGHYEWLSKINHKVLDEGCELSDLGNYAKKRIKELSGITFEEILDMRKKLITPERLACAIVKPV